MTDLTHLDAEGRARMVDVSAKPETAREAVATGRVRMNAATLKMAIAGDAKKGDVRTVAEIAGVMAAKKTSELIPLCHPIALSSIKVSVEPDEAGRPRRRLYKITPHGSQTARRLLSNVAHPLSNPVSVGGQ